MPNYQNGKLYTIRSHQTDKVYVGSTVQELSVRMAGHRSDFKGYTKGGTNYVTSFELLKYNDAYIELIELYPCNSKVELDRGEGIPYKGNYSGWLEQKQKRLELEGKIEEAYGSFTKPLSSKIITILEKIL